VRIDYIHSPKEFPIYPTVCLSLTRSECVTDMHMSDISTQRDILLSHWLF